MQEVHRIALLGVSRSHLTKVYQQLWKCQLSLPIFLISSLVKLEPFIAGRLPLNSRKRIISHFRACCVQFTLHMHSSRA